MPYKNSEKAKQSARERKKRWLEKHRPADWTDKRGKHGNHSKGSNHYRWQDTLESSEGYRKVRVGKTHPLSDPNGYAYEHLMVWASAGNALPGSGVVIHHINHDKLDNRLENLECISRSEHNKHHNEEKERDALGRFDGRTWEEFPGD